MRRSRGITGGKDAAKEMERSRHADSNRGPAVYETAKGATALLQNLSQLSQSGCCHRKHGVFTVFPAASYHEAAGQCKPFS